MNTVNNYNSYSKQTEVGINRIYLSLECICIWKTYTIKQTSAFVLGLYLVHISIHAPAQGISYTYTALREGRHAKDCGCIWSEVKITYTTYRQWG